MIGVHFTFAARLESMPLALATSTWQPGHAAGRVCRPSLGPLARIIAGGHDRANCTDTFIRHLPIGNTCNGCVNHVRLIVKSPVIILNFCSTLLCSIYRIQLSKQQRFVYCSRLERDTYNELPQPLFTCRNRSDCNSQGGRLPRRFLSIRAHNLASCPPSSWTLSPRCSPKPFLLRVHLCTRLRHRIQRWQLREAHEVQDCVLARLSQHSLCQSE